MDPLTRARSQNEESDFAAERRWESEGGNPGELKQALCNDQKEDATSGPAAPLTPKRPERTRGERRLVTKYEANSPTKQRDLFQTT